VIHISHMESGSCACTTGTAASC